MTIKFRCEDCGRLLGEVEFADKPRPTKAFRAPCGSRVCPSCCKKCRQESEKTSEPCRMGESHVDH